MAVNEVNEADSGIPRALSSRGLHGQVLDRIGLAICSGEVTPGSVLKIFELERDYGVSRSVMREVLRVLEALGLVASRRRVGVVALSATAWNLYDSQVIRWRLASPARIAQLRSLTELRLAVEPEAARLAAVRAPLINAGGLMGLAGKLWVAGEAEDQTDFVQLDIQFHRLVLSSSGNEMFERLSAVVAEMLGGRWTYGLAPRHTHLEALQLHVDVASAIQRGVPDDAHDAMKSIMQRTMHEVNSIEGSSADGAELHEVPQGVLLSE
ncbi:FadR/GntR family transcriptional regulator [Demequina lutea]|uniref:DNA-binding FadR family transcriptional regulator n=1 Tax=Demequina lutea TaxID=431489 RepID=A0A7Z0CH59_9MICO|nr:FCD domain-containing protein [Demequina lutea]NYI40499.1 DNA-binding FadR family transcriptional regulator [Demequina lutea]